MRGQAVKRLVRLVAWFLVAALFLTIVTVCLKIPPVLAMAAELSLTAALSSLWKNILIILVCLVLICLLVLALNKTRLTAEQERAKKNKAALKQLTKRSR